MKLDVMKIMQDEMADTIKAYHSDHPLIFKEIYISKKSFPSVNTIKFKPVDNGVQIFANSGDHKAFFRLNKEQVKQLKEWLDANEAQT